MNTTLAEIEFIELARGPRRVRTPEGAQFYGVPIGAIITKDMIDAKKAEAQAKGVTPPKGALSKGSSTGYKKPKSSAPIDNTPEAKAAQAANAPQVTQIPATISGPKKFKVGEKTYGAPTGSIVIKPVNKPGIAYVRTPDGAIHAFNELDELEIPAPIQAIFSKKFTKDFKGDDLYELDTESSDEDVKALGDLPAGAVLHDTDGNVQFKKMANGDWENPDFGAIVTDDDLQEMYDAGELTTPDTKHGLPEEEFPDYSAMDKPTFETALGAHPVGHKLNVSNAVLTKNEDGTWNSSITGSNIEPDKMFPLRHMISPTPPASVEDKYDADLKAAEAKGEEPPKLPKSMEEAAPAPKAEKAPAKPAEATPEDKKKTLTTAFDSLLEQGLITPDEHKSMVDHANATLGKSEEAPAEKPKPKNSPQLEKKLEKEGPKAPKPKLIREPKPKAEEKSEPTLEDFKNLDWHKSVPMGTKQVFPMGYMGSKMVLEKSSKPEYWRDSGGYGYGNEEVIKLIEKGEQDKAASEKKKAEATKPAEKPENKPSFTEKEFASKAGYQAYLDALQDLDHDDDNYGEEELALFDSYSDMEDPDAETPDDNSRPASDDYDTPLSIADVQDKKPGDMLHFKLGVWGAEDFVLVKGDDGKWKDLDSLSAMSFENEDLFGDIEEGLVHNADPAVVAEMKEDAKSVEADIEEAIASEPQLVDPPADKFKIKKSDISKAIKGTVVKQNFDDGSTTSFTKEDEDQWSDDLNGFSWTDTEMEEQARNGSFYLDEPAVEPTPEPEPEPLPSISDGTKPVTTMEDFGKLPVGSTVKVKDSLYVKQESGEWLSSKSANLFTDDQFEMPMEAGNIYVKSTSPDEAPKIEKEPSYAGAEYLGPGVDATPQQMKDALDGLKGHTGFQIAYGLKSVDPNNPVVKNQQIIKSQALEAYPDLKPKQAFVKYLESKLGIAPEKIEAPAETADDGGPSMTIGSRTPKDTQTGATGGSFSKTDLQNAVDLLEGSNSKMIKNVLNTGGNPLGGLNINEIVGFNKDKEVTKKKFIDLLKSKLSKSNDKESLDALKAKISEPLPKVESMLSLDDDLGIGSQVGLEEHPDFSWTKLGNNQWENDKTGNVHTNEAFEVMIGNGKLSIFHKAVDSPEGFPEDTASDDAEFIEAEVAPTETDFNAAGHALLSHPDVKKIGGQKGSNSGGLYEIPTVHGVQRYYVKKAQTPDHGRNEALANKLYERLGVHAPTVDYEESDGNIYSKIVDGKQDMSSRLNDQPWLDKVRKDFAIDAWLSNRDVFGMSYDNIITDTDGNPVRIDNGGALTYRAMGSKKADFGVEVNELNVFRTGKKEKVFGPKMTLEQELDGVKRLMELSPDEIKKMVSENNLSDELAQKLIDRREYIAGVYGLPDEVPVDAAEAESVEIAEPVDPLSPAAIYADWDAQEKITDFEAFTALPVGSVMAWNQYEKANIWTKTHDDNWTNALGYNTPDEVWNSPQAFASGEMAIISKPKERKQKVVSTGDEVTVKAHFPQQVISSYPVGTMLTETHDDGTVSVWTKTDMNEWKSTNPVTNMKLLAKDNWISAESHDSKNLGDFDIAHVPDGTGAIKSLSEFAGLPVGTKVIYAGIPEEAYTKLDDGWVYHDGSPVDESDFAQAIKDGEILYDPAQVNAVPNPTFDDGTILSKSQFDSLPVGAKVTHTRKSDGKKTVYTKTDEDKWAMGSSAGGVQGSLFVPYLDTGEISYGDTTEKEEPTSKFDSVPDADVLSAEEIDNIPIGGTVTVYAKADDSKRLYERSTENSWEYGGTGAASTLSHYAMTQIPNYTDYKVVKGQVKPTTEKEYSDLLETGQITYGQYKEGVASLNESKSDDVDWATAEEVTPESAPEPSEPVKPPTKKATSTNVDVMSGVKGSVAMHSGGQYFYTHEDGGHWHSFKGGMYTGPISSTTLKDLADKGDLEVPDTPSFYPGKYASVINGNAYMVVNLDGSGVYVNSKGAVSKLTPARVQKNHEAGMFYYHGPMEAPAVTPAAAAGPKAPAKAKTPLGDVTLSDGTYYLGMANGIGATTYTVAGDKVEIHKDGNTTGPFPLSKIKTAYFSGKVLNSEGTSVLPENYNGPVFFMNTPTTAQGLVAAKKHLDDVGYEQFFKYNSSKINALPAKGLVVDQHSLFQKAKQADPSIPESAYEIQWNDASPSHKKGFDFLNAKLDAVLTNVDMSEPDVKTKDLFEWGPAGDPNFPQTVAATSYNTYSIPSMNEYMGVISQAIGDGKILQYKGLGKYEKQQWINNFQKGNFAAMYKLEVAAFAKKGKAHPAGYMHPGFPDNEETNVVAWGAAVPGEISASKEIPGSWSDVHVNSWSKEEVDNYLIAAKMQNPTFLTAAEKRSWVATHKIKNKEATDKLSAQAQAKKEAGGTPVSEQPVWTDNIKPAKVYDYWFDDKPFPTSVDVKNAPYTTSKAWAKDNWDDKDFQKILTEKGSTATSPEQLGQYGVASDYVVEEAVAEYLGGLHDEYEAELLKPVFSKVKKFENNANEVWLVKDQFDRKYIFKVIPEGKEFRAEGEIGSNKLGQFFGFSSINSKIGEVEGQKGQIQDFYPNVGDFSGTADGDPIEMNSLSEKQLGQVAAEHVLDWILDNDDTHEENLLIGNDGKIVGIDKGRGLFVYGNWNGLSQAKDKEGRHGAHSNAALVYTRLYDDIRAGKLSKAQVDAAYNAAMKAAKRIEKSNNARVSEIVHEASAHRTDWSVPDYMDHFDTSTAPKSADELAEAVLARKSNIVNDIDTMWSKIYKKAGLDKPEPPEKILGEDHLSGWEEKDLNEKVDAAMVWGVAPIHATPALAEGASLLWKETGSDDKDQFAGQFRLGGISQKKVLDYLINKTGLIAGSNSQSSTAMVQNFPDFTSQKKTITAAGKDVTTHAVDKAYTDSIWDSMISTEHQIDSDLAAWTPDGSNFTKYTDDQGNEFYATKSGKGVPVEALPQYKAALDHYKGMIEKVKTAKADGVGTNKGDFSVYSAPAAKMEGAVLTSPEGVKWTELANGKYIKSDGTFAEPSELPAAAKKLEDGWISETNIEVNEDPNVYTIVQAGQYSGQLSSGGVKKVGETFSGSGHPGKEYRIGLPTGEVIHFRNSASTNTAKSQRGRVTFTLAKGVDPQSSLERINAQLSTMGIDMSAATEEDAETIYWRQMFGRVIHSTGGTDKDIAARKKLEAMMPELKTQLGNQTIGYHELVEAIGLAKGDQEHDFWHDLAVETYGSEKVSNWIADGNHLPKYQHMDLTDTTKATGKPYWNRIDVDIAALKKKKTLIGIGANSKDQAAHNYINSGGAISTEERLRILGFYKDGLSSSADQGHGSSGGVFTRVAKGSAELKGSYFPPYASYWSPEVFAQTGTYSYSGDNFGEIDSMRSGNSLDPMKSLGFTGSSNETLVANGIATFDFMELLVFDSHAERDLAIQRMKEMGIETLRGLPIEDRLVARVNLKQAMEKVKNAWTA